MRFFDLAQPVRHQVQGLVPARLPEFAVLLDERRGQALGGVNKVEAETSLDAQRTVIRRRLFDTGDFDHPVVLNVQMHLAADPAVTAGGADFRGLPGADIVAYVFLDQRPHRAGLDAFTAEYAVRIFQRPVTGSDDLGACAPEPEVNGVVDLNLVAGLNTPPTLDTAGKISHDERIDGLHRIGRIGGGKTFTGYLVAVGQVLKPAIAPDRAQFLTAVVLLDIELKLGPVLSVGTAHGAVVIARGKQELQDQFTGLDDGCCFRLHVHVVPGRG